LVHKVFHNQVQTQQKQESELEEILIKIHTQMRYVEIRFNV
jgi:hypothetical protein